MGRTIDITAFSPITVDRLTLSKWLVDLDENKVVAVIKETDSDNSAFHIFEVTFWETMPEMPEILDFTDPENPVPFDPPQYEPTPETWYTLPVAHVAELVSQSDDILAAVKGRLYS